MVFYGAYIYLAGISDFVKYNERLNCHETFMNIPIFSEHHKYFHKRMLLFLYYSLLNVGYGKTIWVRQGETAVVRCKKPGQMVRFEEPGQVLALKFNSSKPQMIAPKITFWELDDSNRK